MKIEFSQVETLNVQLKSRVEAHKRSAVTRFAYMLLSYRRLRTANPTKEINVRRFLLRRERESDFGRQPNGEFH